MIVNSFAQLMLPNDLHCNHDVYVLGDFRRTSVGIRVFGINLRLSVTALPYKISAPRQRQCDAEKHRLAPTCASHGPTLIVARPMQLFIIKRGER